MRSAIEAHHLHGLLASRTAWPGAENTQVFAATLLAGAEHQCRETLELTRRSLFPVCTELKLCRKDLCGQLDTHFRYGPANGPTRHGDPSKGATFNCSIVLMLMLLKFYSRSRQWECCSSNLGKVVRTTHRERNKSFEGTAVERWA